MKKEMFSDRFDLTEMVINSYKTNTRRISKHQSWSFHEIVNVNENHYYEDNYCTPKYKIGEVVAIAQKYKDIPLLKETDLYVDEGWKNKMFVRSEYMPHQIQITDIKIERLQDISYKECLEEGIRQFPRGNYYYYDRKYKRSCFMFKSAREAFASLIDKICGKGTWESNPYVFAYEFKLIK